MNSEIDNYSVVIDVVSRALGFIDERLVGHGQRVAYLCMKMLDTGGKTDFLDRKKLFFLSLLHDIGAYKTEDIDRMLEFETVDVNRHAMYGYLFLKNRSFLADSAKAILYHHARYDKLPHIDSESSCGAALIHLCDRIDIMHNCDGVTDADIERLSGSIFDPELVGQYHRCDRIFHTGRKLSNGEWNVEYEDMKSTVEVSRDEALTLLRMLIFAIDFRSPVTVTHTAAVVAYSRELGKAAGLDGNELQELLIAAFMHDIGKIATPVEILEKPGKLTADEMIIMKEHVIHTEQILRGLVPDRIKDIAASHHEKLNGTGYPNGYSGDELTLQQRILAVADIVSALTGRRSYKDSFSKEHTIGIICKMRDGGELSPEICDMLINDYDGFYRRTAEEIEPALRLYNRIGEEYSELLVSLSEENNS